ncbi:tRNA 2-thiouridine synthesizing protein C [Paraperlucidibaca baekdonensis]|uniref:tRNA 2-thiouridine synthesizing protein C n=1 Tax=Paraperlucidibaca baekdonensis TaxID=748120 RepID=A0A3E0H683_9GAMM|nr:DsrE family protein [Paraperlucidibaca baekdonensis]REH39013.1 tRNA 2-thiouridine synthesizing protein C [Paraperlucidibaca baekdonensis]
MRLLYIAASDPYANQHAQTLLDALLVAASFGAQVSVLFQGHGLLQLMPEQDGALLSRRSLGAQLDALPLFDIDAIYVDHADAQRFGLADTGFEALHADAIAALIAAHDQVIRL